MGKKASLKINFIMNSLLTMSQFIFREYPKVCVNLQTDVR